MSSLQHAVTGTALTFSLEEEMRIVRGNLAEVDERIGRTLLKNGPLRVTLVALKPGGALQPHHSEGPITVQVLEGSVEFEADGKVHQLPAGTLFSLAPRIVHSVTSATGGIFLLTLALPAAGAGDPPPPTQPV